MAYQILNPGIKLWFNHEKSAVIGYVQAGSYRVVVGAPLAADTQLASVIAQFDADTHQAHLHVCYFGAQSRISAIIGETGPAAQLLLGAQPVWNPQDWLAIVQQKASLRGQLARARNKGIEVSEWPSELATEHSALRRCLMEWLSNRRLPTLHFAVEPETLARLGDRRVFVAQHQQQVLGFLVATPIPQRHGWLIEQIVRGQAAPNGLAELLIDSAMRALAADGAQYVTLGLAPLSQRAQSQESPHPRWVKLLLKGMRIYGRHAYNFEGLENFKAKLQPDRWEPVYALTRGRWIGATALYAIVGAFGGTSPLRFVSHALLHTVWQEYRMRYLLHARL